MKVTQITLIEQGDFNFKVSFLFKDHNLETPPLARTASADDVQAAIRQAVNRWKDQRAEDNFKLLQDTLEGQELEV